MDIIAPSPTILQSAIHYASLGYRVFPLHGIIGGCCTCGKPPGDGHKVGKHPATINGCHDGTTDAGVITVWFTEKPWANLGIALDRHVLGLDVDPRHGGDKTMASWEGEHGHLALTPHARTGSGGDHWYFRLPPGVIVKNRANVAPGIDTRSAGGYLVAPPSRHESGGVYSWIEPLDKPPTMAPEWLLKIVGESPSLVASAIAPRSRSDREGDSKSGNFIFSTSDEPDDFASHPGAGSGKRNDVLCRLAGVHLSRGDSLKSIEEMAVRWGGRCTPPCEQEGIVQKVRALAIKDAAKRGVSPDSMGGFRIGMNASGEGTGGMESKFGPNASPQNFGSIPFQNSGLETPERNPGSDILSPSTLSPQPHEHELCLMKNPSTFERHEPAIELEEFSQEALPPLRGGESNPLTTGEGSEAESEGFVFQADTASVEPQSDWPTLHEDAYHGLAGDIVKAIEPETEADGVGVLVTLLACVGNAIGRSPYFAVNAGSHHTNFFAAIVGNTASRKGMSLDVAKYLMRKADADWYNNHIGYGLSSGEGLIERVRDEDEPEGQAFFEFAAQHTKRLFNLEAEFVKLLQVKGREGNTLNANIRNAWDGSPMESITKSKKGQPKNKATNHHISILGHITPKELQKTMGGSVDMSNGFCNRFLWALVKRARYLPEGGDITVLDEYIDPLRSAIEKAKGVGRVVRDDEAKAMWAEVYYYSARSS